jgi:hypothetical protein
LNFSEWKLYLSWALPEISALGRLSQEDHNFEVNLDYISKKKKKKIKEKTTSEMKKYIKQD